eukprot:763689-Hanusia_phi.AAC.2
MERRGEGEGAVVLFMVTVVCSLKVHSKRGGEEERRERDGKRNKLMGSRGGEERSSGGEMEGRWRGREEGRYIKRRIDCEEVRLDFVSTTAPARSLKFTPLQTAHLPPCPRELKSSIEETIPGRWRRQGQRSRQGSRGRLRIMLPACGKADAVMTREGGGPVLEESVNDKMTASRIASHGA